jgi:hypothetical protein
VALLATLVAPLVPTAYADTWEVAGLVNLGEPTLRVVYDTSVFGSRGRAQGLVRDLQNQFWYLDQPGTTAGLMQVAYSDHIDGVQIQLYSNNAYTGARLFTLFESYGINMTGCWEKPSACPTWSSAA